MERWAEINRCRRGPSEDQFSPTVVVSAYEACKANADVVLYTSTIGGHTWPGRPDPTGGLYGPADQSLPANDLMLDFFARHKLKG
jgi:poly(3-hydroxybutyrate) depolymerase